jgi:hypothetical protein
MVRYHVGIEEAVKPPEMPPTKRQSTMQIMSFIIKKPPPAPPKEGSPVECLGEYFFEKCVIFSIVTLYNKNKEKKF